MAPIRESSRRRVSHRYAPAKLKALKGRCRQTARAFWYEWREMLEQDLGAKLGRAAECFDADLGALAAHGARLAQLGAQARRLRPIATRCPHSLTAIAPQISAAAPAPIDPAKLERLSADLKSAEAALAARQSAAASAEQQRAALTAQVEAAEEALRQTRQQQSAQQAQLVRLQQAAPASDFAGPTAGLAAEEAVLEALQVRCCVGSRPLWADTGSVS